MDQQVTQDVTRWLWCSCGPRVASPSSNDSAEGVHCTAVEEVLSLLAQGLEARHVGQTKMNAASSRSHVIFACNVDCTTVVGGVTSVQTSCINLVDLAGKPLLTDMSPCLSSPSSLSL